MLSSNITDLVYLYTISSDSHLPKFLMVMVSTLPFSINRQRLCGRCEGLQRRLVSLPKQSCIDTSPHLIKSKMLSQLGGTHIAILIDIVLRRSQGVYILPCRLHSRSLTKSLENGLILAIQVIYNTNILTDNHNSLSAGRSVD